MFSGTNFNSELIGLGVISGKMTVWAPQGPKVGHLRDFCEKMRFLLNNFLDIRVRETNVRPFLKHLARRIEW